MEIHPPDQRRRSVAPLPHPRMGMRWRLRSGTTLAALTLFVNTALPKGGFYVQGIPVTWGYILLGVSGSIAFIALLARQFRPLLSEVIAVGFCLLFSTFCTVSILMSGNTAPPTALLSFLVTTWIIPPFSVLSTGYLLRRVGRDAVLRILRTSFLLITSWGLLHFAAMNLMGSFWGIPYLTVTGTELDISTTRSINRGNVLKMVSTYNNGNILGINLLMWFPMIALGSRHIPALPALGGHAVLLLSLSRTVWAGWLFGQATALTYALRKWKSLAFMLFAMPLAMVTVVGVAMIWFKSPLQFIFDETLGGRREQLSQSFSLLPGPFHQIQEIVYSSILLDFGLPGLLLFLAAWAYPLVVPVYSRVGRLAKTGLATYFVLMLSDGAFTLVPTQYTYWMVASVILFENSRSRPQATTESGFHAPPRS